MQTERTTVKRRPQRASYELETIKEILDEAFVCTVSYVANGTAKAVPTSYARMGDKLLLHGSTRAGWLSELTGGCEICITVTIVDSIVLASTMLHHSLNYRSVVLFAVPEIITGAEAKSEALSAIVDHIVPGRSADLPLPSPSDLRQTQVATVTISEASAKIRQEGPSGSAAEAPWCGEIPITTSYGTAVQLCSVAVPASTPSYIEHYRRPGGIKP